MKTDEIQGPLAWPRELVDPILTSCAVVVQVEYLSVCYLPFFSWLLEPFPVCPFLSFELCPILHNMTLFQTNARRIALVGNSSLKT